MSGRARVLLRLLVAIVLLVLVFRVVSPGDVLARLRAAPWWAFATAAGCLGVNSVFHAHRIRFLLPAPRPPWWRLLRAILLGSFFGLVLPTGGSEAARVLILRREVGGLDAAVAAMGMARVLELVAWSLLCLYGAVFVLPGDWPWLVPITLGAAAAMAGIVALVVAGLLRGEGLVRRLPRRIGGPLGRVLALRASAADLARSTLLVVPTAVLNCGIVWVVLRAYAAPMSFADVLGLVPALDVLIALPVTISGVGVREGVFQVALAARGVAPEVAVAVAFTRWTGELARAAAGGLLFVTSPGGLRRVPVTFRD